MTGVSHVENKKNFYNSTRKRQKTQFKNKHRIWNRLFSKENMWMASNYMKRCSISLATRETQLKTTMRYHFAPTNMATIIIITEQQNITSVDEDAEKLEHAYVACRSVKWCSHCTQQFGSPLISYHRITTWHRNSISWYILKRTINKCSNTYVHKYSQRHYSQ